MTLNPDAFDVRLKTFTAKPQVLFIVFSLPRCGRFSPPKQDMQYQEQKRAMETGMPAFQIYVRTKLNNMW